MPTAKTPIRLEVTPRYAAAIEQAHELGYVEYHTCAYGAARLAQIWESECRAERRACISLINLTPDVILARICIRHLDNRTNFTHVAESRFDKPMQRRITALLAEVSERVTWNWPGQSCTGFNVPIAIAPFVARRLVVLGGER